MSLLFLVLQQFNDSENFEVVCEGTIGGTIDTVYFFTHCFLCKESHSSAF